MRYDGPMAHEDLSPAERKAIDDFLATRRAEMNVAHYALDFLELAHHALEKLLTGELELSTPDEALKAIRAGTAGYKELAGTLRAGGFGDDDVPSDEEFKDPEVQKVALAEVRSILDHLRSKAS